MSWPTATVSEALARVSAGETQASVCRQMGIPYPTLKRWRAGRIPAPAAPPPLPLPARDEHAYAYLLGVYLGDGCLARHKMSWKLQVSLDTAHRGVIEEVSLAVAWLRGREPTHAEYRTEKMVNLYSYWKHWPALLPQHGPGRKHHRSITLEPWQQEIVGRYPGELLRGLIHTDGWRGENRVVAKGRAYSYPRYQFSNRSDDIRGIFCDACDQLGVAWRPWGRWNISVARRDAVALLDEHVGRKT